MGRCHHTTEATGTAPTEMGQSIQLVLIVSLLSLFPGSQGQGEECCAVKVVENSPDSSLDGTYTLSDNGAKREEICIDGCVYERDGLEYCFIPSLWQRAPMSNVTMDSPDPPNSQEL